MRILVVSTSRKTRGGIASVVKAHEQGAQWGRYHCRWIETHRDTNHLLKLLIFAKSVFLYLLLILDANLVHIHVSTLISAKRKYVFYAIARFLKKKIVIHFHACNVDNSLCADRSLYAKMFSGADRVLVLSEQWRQLLTDILQISENVEVVYNPCIRVSDVDISAREQNSMKEILFAGSVIPRKGYGDLIKAFAGLAADYPQWKLCIAGNGEINKAHSLCRELSIEDKVHFTGWISGDTKDSYFRRACIFCLPSYEEGFPMAILDAWAYGLPVVATKVGGIPDLVIHGGNGLLCEAGNIYDLQGQLETMMRDTFLRERIAYSSIQLAHTTFNQDTINSQIEKIYYDLLD